MPRELPVLEGSLFLRCRSACGIRCGRGPARLPRRGREVARAGDQRWLSARAVAPLQSTSPGDGDSL
eukprot:4945470-Alexandrium_andersonii.AAC.1